MCLLTPDALLCRVMKMHLRRLLHRHLGRAPNYPVQGLINLEIGTSRSLQSLSMRYVKDFPSVTTPIFLQAYVQEML
jgi:hypothetical protein